MLKQPTSLFDELTICHALAQLHTPVRRFGSRGFFLCLRTRSSLSPRAGLTTCWHRPISSHACHVHLSRPVHPAQEYLMDDGSLTGKDIGECIVPSNMGIDLMNLSKGMEAQPEPAAKKQKV